MKSQVDEQAGKRKGSIEDEKDRTEGADVLARAEQIRAEQRTTGQGRDEKMRITNEKQQKRIRYEKSGETSGREHERKDE